MGKSDRNTATDMAKKNYDRAVGQGDELQGELKGDLPGAKARSDTAYGSAEGAFSGSTGSTGAYDPDQFARLHNQNANNMATGGYDPNAMSTLRSDINANYKSGGYDQATLDRLGSNGGLDPTQTEKIRGGYGQLADTGGISETTADAMRRQSASGVQSIYSTLGAKLARSQAAQGFGGGGGETAEMARQAAQAQATATTGVNAKIGEIRQQGTIAGLGGLSNFEQGAASGAREVGADVARGRLTSTGQEAGVAASEAQGRLSASQADQELSTGAAQQKLTAAGGMANLYASSPGYVNSIVQQILQSQATTGTLTAEQAQIMQEISKQPGLFTNIMNGITTVAGAAGGAMAGLGGLGFKPFAK